MTFPMNTTHNQIQNKPWLLCFAGALFFFYEFIQMNMFNALNPSLMRAFAINADQLGNLSACYFYALILMLIPVGILFDHVSAKKLILIAMIISMLGTFSFSMAASFRIAEICRFISGIGGAFAFQGCLRLAMENYPTTRLALVNGLMITFAMLGGIVAQTPLTLLLEFYNWHSVLQLYVAMGGVFYLFILFVFRKKSPTHRETKSNLRASTIKEDVKKSLSNSQTWLAGIYTCLFNLPVPLLGAVWGNFYLSQARHLNRITAANIISFLFIGIIIGTPLFGLLSDYIRQRRLPMIIGALCTLIIVLMIIYLPTPSHFSLGLLFFLLGLFSSTETLGYTVVTESNPESRSTALGISCLIIMVGGALVQPLFGWILELYWGGLITNQIKVYSQISYFSAMLILPCAFIIGLISAFFLKESFFSKIKK